MIALSREQQRPSRKKSSLCCRLPLWMLLLLVVSACALLYTSVALAGTKEAEVVPAVVEVRPVGQDDSRLRSVLGRLQHLQGRQLPVLSEEGDGPVDVDGGAALGGVAAMDLDEVEDRIDENEKPKPALAAMNTAPAVDHAQYAKGYDREILADSTPALVVETLPGAVDTDHDGFRPNVAATEEQFQVGPAPKVLRHHDEDHPRCALEVRVADQGVHTITLELFRKELPRTVDNFIALCLGAKNPAGEHITFEGSLFHRVIPGFMMQAGELAKHPRGGSSLYGERFEDEGFPFLHDSRGVLSMANAGRDTNGSQFFITFKPAPHLDGKHVVFGRVADGWDALTLAEEVRVGPGDRPEQPVAIVACRILDRNE